MSQTRRPRSKENERINSDGGRTWESRNLFVITSFDSGWNLLERLTGDYKFLEEMCINQSNTKHEFRYQGITTNEKILPGQKWKSCKAQTKWIYKNHAIMERMEKQMTTESFHLVILVRYLSSSDLQVVDVKTDASCWFNTNQPCTLLQLC